MKSVIALVGACVAGLVLAGTSPVLAQSASSDPDTGFELAVSGPSVVRYDRDARFRGVAYRVRGLATLVALPGRLRARFRTDTTRGPWREVTADAHGRFEVAVPIGRGDDAPRIEVEVGQLGAALAVDDEDDADADADADAESGEDENAEGEETARITAPRARRFVLPVTTRAPWEMTLYTDRRLYEPGEPVHVWALVRDGATGAPITGRPIVVHLQGAPLASTDASVSTNEAGVAHYALTLGEHAPEGMVNVSLSLDDETVETGFEVGQRVWERIFAHADVSPAEVQPGGDAEVRVHVTTPDATPVPSAEVSVMVGSDVGGSAMTDAQGDAVVHVHAPAYLPGETGSTGIRVHVSHPAHGAIDVTAVMHVAVPLALEVDVVPTHGALVPEIDDVVLVHLSDALGEPPPAGTEIEVTGPAIPHGTARGRTDANGLVEIGVHLPIGASSGAYEEPHSTMRVHVLGAALERLARITVPVSRTPEVVPTVLHPVLAPGASVEVRLARRPSARGLPLVVELVDPHGEIGTVTYVAQGAESARLALPPGVIGRFSVRARAIHEDESLEGVGASTELLVVPPSPDFVSIVPERVRWQVGERARVDLVSQPNGPRAWGALLVRDLAAHGGERDFTQYFLERAFDQALLTPHDAVGERLVRASLAASAAVDAAPPVASPLVDALGLPSESSEAADISAERGTLRDPWPLARELSRRGVGDAMRALEERLVSALDGGGLDELTMGRGAQRRFRQSALVELGAEGLVLRSLGDGDLTPAMLTSADPSFTYEHVARRVARMRLVQLLVALATYVDPGDEASLEARTAVREPWQRWLARMVERGVIASEALDDPWGGRFVLTPSAHPSIVLAPEAAGVELVSPGPDGRPGTADDVRDPFGRAVPAGTPYAVASGEDALMRQLAILSPVDATLAGLRAAYQRISAEMTEDEIGDAVHASVSEGTIGMGMLGTIGHGAGGGGTGYGYGSGSGGLRGRSVGAPSVRFGGANLARLVRERFPPTVLFTPTFALDPSGHTHLEIPLADAVTTYRVEAIVWREDGWVWSARTEITSDREIVVDAPIPTVAHVGDRLTLPVRVSNRGTTERTLRVALLGDETLGIPDAEPVTVTVPAGDAQAVPFEVALGVRGEGSLRVVATDADGNALDAVRRPLLVRRASRRVEVRREMLVEREGELSFEVPADAEAIAGRVTLAVGADMFFHDFHSSWLAWADPTDPRLAEVVTDLESRDARALAFSMGAACTRTSFDDDTLRTAAERLTASLETSARSAEDGTAAWTLLGLAPCMGAAHDRPELAADLTRLIDRIARQVGDAAVTVDDPLCIVTAAAALARAGGDRMQPRARELVRRLDDDLVRVGDDLWLATPERATTATLLHATADLALGDRQRAFALLATVARWVSRGRDMTYEELALARAVALGLGGTVETSVVRMRVDDHDVELLHEGASDEPGVAAPGAHRVVVRADDDVPLRAVLEARYGVPWTTLVEREGPFAISIEGEAHAQDEVAELELVVRNRSPRWIARPIVELSLPTGAELTAAQVMAIRGAAREVTLAEGLLTVRLRALAPGAEGRVRLPIRWSVAGTLAGIGVAAHAADRDDAISVLSPAPLVIPVRGSEGAASHRSTPPPTAPPSTSTTGGAR